MPTFKEQQVELNACRMSPVYFFRNYVFIQDRLLGVIRWEDWEYQTDLLETFEREHEIVICKARQLGISWLVSGYGLWMALFRPSSKILMFSQGESEAWDMLRKCKFILNHLPDFMRASLAHESRGWIEFAVNGSEIRAYPSTEKAGRSTDATLVVRDELENHPYGKENFLSVSPTIDAGGKLIDLSTVNKDNTDSHFHERINKAMSGDSNSVLVFLPWNLRPVRKQGMTLDEWFEENIKRKYEPWQIEQEYPSELNQALAPLSTRKFFNEDGVKAMLPDCSDEYLISDPSPEVDNFNGVVRVYKLPLVGRQYVLYTDPSGGSEDPFTTAVIDLQTWETVADAHSKVPPDRVARIHDSLVRSYNNAFNSFEKNAWAGGKVEEHLITLETPNMSPFIKPNGTHDDKKIGIWASVQMKRKMLTGLEEAVRAKLLRIHNKEAYNQFNSFIIPVNKDGSSGEPRVSKGLHDDFIAAYAGVWELQNHAPISAGDVKSYSPASR